MIDYSAFEKDYKIKNLYPLRFGFTFVIAGAIYFIIWAAEPHNIKALLFIILLSVPLLAYLVIATTEAERREQRLAKMRQCIKLFVSSNSFTYVSSEPTRKNQEVGTYFKNAEEDGDRSYARTIISGKIDGLSFKQWRYSYVMNEGERNESTSSAMVFKFDLPNTLPHMVIDSFAGSTRDGYSILPVTFDTSQAVSLEGDFDRYYKVYVADKQAAEALMVLTPDVMQLLLDARAMCDIEIIGKNIYFYWADDVDSPQAYRHMFQTTERIIREIRPTLVRSIAATAEPHELRSYSNSQLAYKYSPLKLVLFILFFASPLIAFFSIVVADAVSADDRVIDGLFLYIATWFGFMVILGPVIAIRRRYVRKRLLDR